MAVFQKMAIGHAGDYAVRALFQSFAHAAGLHGFNRLRRRPKRLQRFDQVAA